NSTPACSSSIWPSWRFYSKDREQALTFAAGALTTLSLRDLLRHVLRGPDIAGCCCCLLFL
ncbi:hypothetical protein, partial [Xanthomonas fragariae]|uniref:hypothetical protein n=1 Tax=Xanthomonas fragariae TaxID=48664 RepID=UPI0025A0AF6D